MIFTVNILSVTCELVTSHPELWKSWEKRHKRKKLGFFFLFDSPVNCSGLEDHAFNSLGCTLCWRRPAVSRGRLPAFWIPCWLRGWAAESCTLHLWPRTWPPGVTAQCKASSTHTTRSHNTPSAMLVLCYPVLCEHAACHHVVGEYESYHVKRRRCLLKEAHQASLAEVLPSTNPLLFRRQDIIRYCRLLQDVGRNVLRGKRRNHNKQNNPYVSLFQQSVLIKSWNTPCNSARMLPISVVYSQMSHQIKQPAPTWNVTQPIGRYRQSSSMLRYSATRAALWTRQWAASAWFPLSECFPAMFWSHVRRRSGEFW